MTDTAPPRNQKNQQKPANTTAPTFAAMPPHNHELERGLIGAIIRRHEALDEVVDIITTDDFRDPIARECWIHAQKLHADGDPVELVPLYAALNAAKSSITPSMLSDMLQAAPIAAIPLARQIRALSERRAIMQAAAGLFEAAADTRLDTAAAANMAARVVDDILAGRVMRHAETLQDVVARVVYAAMHGSQIRPVLTPYEHLNRITGGLHPGELVVLAGRPGTGKTALALNIAAAAMAHHAVGVFSLEMSRESLVQRMAATACSLDAQKFRRGVYTQSDIQALQRYKISCSHPDIGGRTPMRISDTPRTDPDSIRAECRAWKRTGGLDLVIIDYLQLIQPPTARKESTREREVADITRSLKALAIELGVPIVLLAQLNRAVETRKDASTAPTPRLSDLRESGSIEQDADQVWFLSPWNAAQNDVDIVQVRLTVAKSRSSATGAVPMEFVRRHLRYQEASV